MDERLLAPIPSGSPWPKLPETIQSPTAQEGNIMRRAFEIGGIVAAVVLIAFGTAAVVMGFQGRDTVKSNLAAQKIVGTPDMTPAGITAEAKSAHLNVANLTIPSCSVANQVVNSG